jgi:hypothetical protein
MGKREKVMQRSATRISLVLVVLIGSVALVVRPAGATVSPERIPLDLAAIPLTPAEIEAVGLEDYGTDYGWLRTAYEAGRDMPAAYGVPRAELKAALIDEAGLTRLYSLRTARPVERGVADTVATGAVFTGIYEVASAEGAAAGQDYLLGVTTPAGAEPVEASRAFGDASRTMRFGSPDPESADPAMGFELSIRTDTLVVELIVEDVVRAGEEADPPTLDQVEALGDRLLERIETVRTGEFPDLGSRMVRLGVEGERVQFSADRYDVQNGQLIRHFNRSAEIYEFEREMVEEGGLFYRYIINQDIMNDPYDWTKAPGAITKLERLTGEAAAAAWLAKAHERIGRWSSLDTFESVDRELFFGDEAVAFAFTIDRGSGPLSGHALFVRSGSDVVEVRVYGPDGVSLATAATIAKAQLDCLRGFRCLERLPVPEELKAAA